MATQQKRAIYFELSEELDHKIRQLAQREDRTLAAQLRSLIREATEKQGAGLAVQPGPYEAIGD